MMLAEKIEAKIQESVNYLAQVLTMEVQTAKTHKTVIISGWNQNDETRKAIAHYLVGLRVSAIDAALTICANLEDTEEDKAEVLENVVEIVGENNEALSDDQKQDDRNPWIAEGIWHLCLAILSLYKHDWHLPGKIVAVNYAHVKGKDRGADVSAIYEIDPLFGLSLIESKAYKNRPNSAINDAVGFFKDVNTGKHNSRIRRMVQIMRKSLSPDKQSKIAGSFWKRSRVYFPNPHYDSEEPIDWTNTRPSFRGLAQNDVDIQVIIMPHIIEDFDGFFDAISDEMRVFAKELGNV